MWRSTLWVHAWLSESLKGSQVFALHLMDMQILLNILATRNYLNIACLRVEKVGIQRIQGAFRPFPPSLPLPLPLDVLFSNRPTLTNLTVFF